MKRKEYKVSKNVTKQMLLDAGFRQTFDGYLYHKYLYKNTIGLTLLLSLDDMEIDCINVNNEMLRQTYAPFYNDYYYSNNLVLDEVNKRYNSTMRGLVKKGILV